MTDTISASPFSLLKKRSSAMDEDEMVTDATSFMQSHKRQRGESPKAFHQPHSRDAENFSPQAGFNVAQLPKPNNAFAGALLSQNYIDQLLKSQEAQTTAMRSEHQKAMELKECELAQLKALNQKLIHELQKGMSDNHHVHEENKVLKRAVQIQDAKQKEMLQQNEQYQHIIRLATEHIQNLESANRNLRQELDMSRHGNNFGNFPPPDVY